MLEHNSFYLYLIRHGQSEANIAPDLVGGFPHTLLTEKGKEQAWKLNARLKKENLRFNKIFSSNYVRAYDTAKIAVCESTSEDRISDITIAPAIREYSAGDWNGASRTKEITPKVKMKMGMLVNAFLPPKGESMHMVERRASQWLEDNILYNKDMIEQAGKRKDYGLPPMEIAAFTHGMTIKCLLHYIMGFDQSFTWKLTIENTAICKLYFGDDGWRLLTINDYAHLL